MEIPDVIERLHKLRARHDALLKEYNENVERLRVVNERKNMLVERMLKIARENLLFALRNPLHDGVRDFLENATNAIYTVALIKNAKDLPEIMKIIDTALGGEGKLLRALRSIPQKDLEAMKQMMVDAVKSYYRDTDYSLRLASDIVTSVLRMKIRKRKRIAKTLSLNNVGIRTILLVALLVHGFLRYNRLRTNVMTLLSAGVGLRRGETIEGLEQKVRQLSDEVARQRREYKSILRELGIKGSIEDHEHIVALLERAKEFAPILDYVRRHGIHPKDANRLFESLRELYSRYGEYALRAPPRDLSLRGILEAITGSRDHAEKLARLLRIEGEKDLRRLEEVYPSVRNHFDAPPNVLRERFNYYGVRRVGDLERLPAPYGPSDFVKAASGRWDKYDEIVFKILNGETVTVGGKRLRLERRGVSHVLLRLEGKKDVKRAKVRLKELKKFIKQLASSSAS